MKQRELISELDNLLNPKLFQDYCPNGLLVDATGDPEHEIAKVVTGVSLRQQLIDRAIDEGAGAIIVHHPNGFWNSEKDKRVIGVHGSYLRSLIKHGISLFGYHLPLDANTIVGNNMTIATELGLAPRYPAEPARFMDGIGVICSEAPVTGDMLSRVFPNGYGAFNFVDGKEYRVAICSGSGTSGMEEAQKLGCNMFITGEIRESTPIFAEEHGMAVVYAGHHRTEVFGVRELAKYLSNRYPVDAKFIDIDNPI